MIDFDYLGNNLNESQEEFFDTKEKITVWLDSNRIKNYTINDDLTVDVDGCVDISEKDFKRIPVKFEKVTGSFWCSNCVRLISLKGCPSSVGGSFWCENCTSLISLDGCPMLVDGYFWCTNTIFEKPHKII